MNYNTLVLGLLILIEVIWITYKIYIRVNTTVQEDLLMVLKDHMTDRFPYDITCNCKEFVNADYVYITKKQTYRFGNLLKVEYIVEADFIEENSNGDEDESV